MVYLPYTHEWNPRTHSLIEMVVAMSSVFSADPPVFTRAAAATTPLPPPPPAYSSYVSSSSNNNNSNSSSAAVTNKNGMMPSTDSEQRYLQEQIAAIMAKEAEEANSAAEVSRKADREEEERKQQIEAQKEWEIKKCEQVRADVNNQIRSYLLDFTEETKSTLSADWRDQEQLKQTKKQIETEIIDLSDKKIELKNHIQTIDAKTKEIQDWLEESKDVIQKTTKETSDTITNDDVDDICQPVNKLNAQMLELSAESAALTDVMYFLDRGLYAGQIDCATNLKMIRKLAKKQFLIRAHLIKINRIVTNSKQLI